MLVQIILRLCCLCSCWTWLVRWITATVSLLSFGLQCEKRKTLKWSKVDGKSLCACFTAAQQTVNIIKIQTAAGGGSEETSIPFQILIGMRKTLGFAEQKVWRPQTQRVLPTTRFSVKRTSVIFLICLCTLSKTLLWEWDGDTRKLLLLSIISKCTKSSDPKAAFCVFQSLRYWLVCRSLGLWRLSGFWAFVPQSN